MQNESLNGGGTLFVKKHPNLKVRVVHGNTLTAAVILNEIDKDVKEVFLTGATSKLGRAIALYLCRKRIRVMVIILSSYISVNNFLNLMENIDLFVGGQNASPITYCICMGNKIDGFCRC